MATAQPAKKLMTTEQFLALPEDDGNHCELFAGELRIEDEAMTTRGALHSICEAKIAYLLNDWLLNNPHPDGLIASGDARCQLVSQPPTIVGIDVAYFTGNKLFEQIKTLTYFEGPPVLAVEILSPSSVHEDVFEKNTTYLNAGTQAVWNVDPDLQTVLVLKPTAEPVLFNKTQRICNQPELPGLDIVVCDLFGDS